MSSLNHTYGPTCRLARAVSSSASKGNEDIPVLKAQFFYSSPLSIDDPLTAAPVLRGTESTVKHPPRPFSTYDNTALEEAWFGLMCACDRSHHGKVMNNTFRIAKEAVFDGGATQNKPRYVASSSSAEVDRPTASLTKSTAFPLSPDIPGPRRFGQAENIRRPQVGGNTHEEVEVPVVSGPPIAPSCPGINMATEVERQSRSSGTKEKDESCIVEQELLTKIPVMDIEAQNREKSIESKSDVWRDECHSSKTTKNKGKELARSDNADDTLEDSKTRYGSSYGVKPSVDQALSNEYMSKKHEVAEMYKHSEDQRECEEHGVTRACQGNGKPNAEARNVIFQRLPSREERVHLRSFLSLPRESNNETGNADHLRGDSHSSQSGVSEMLQAHHCDLNKNGQGLDEVPVGFSRLHFVRLSDLQMRPIYWSPVHDIAVVTRATWFYKDTMYPIEPTLANQLEIGYRQLRPWSQTWSDELSCAIEVGAAGEEKISHRIWPKEIKQNMDRKKSPDHSATESCCDSGHFHGEFAAVGSIDNRPSETTEVKRFQNSHVIYKDAQNAFILKPSLQPSEYYGRKPLAKIVKGITVGIHVVRGFDSKTWEKLHSSRKSMPMRKAKRLDVSEARGTMCAVCHEQEERPRFTDLILVVHGIGQKLSERVESFHFTHTMNTFRCLVNLEHYNLSNDVGGIMVLPVNWRSNLIFEDGESMKSDDKSPDFNMKDITPDTIPAVRNVISDVMFDIPYYMSGHKSKMIRALIAEANRVYKLWCRNNPGFHKEGRVHIVAHSLGSVMALDVLSRQPTLPPSLGNEQLQTRHFEFDTKNVFFAGSPAGFFLLLEKGKLIPRRRRNKPEADREDSNSEEICGDAGTYGCLAVDNIYNVMHYNDPISYKMNAAVDSQYAASLKNAQISNASTGLLGIIGNVIGSTFRKPQASNLGGQITKPSVARLPSQLEMGVRNFSREKIAEKKFFLLNDNGQIDYFIGSRAGPLEIQYLNMLSAHSSYWTSPEFVKMLVIEVSRAPGKSTTLPSMMAVKIGHK